MLTFLHTAILVGLGSLVITIMLIPKLNAVIRFKKIASQPNERSSHKLATPNLGGLAFHVCIMLAFYFMVPFDNSNVIISLIPGLTILFILGLKDDLVILAPLSKLLGQLFAASFLIFNFQFSIESLHGFLGIEIINVYLAKFIALLIIITIINAVNLIDGIDGLAASLSLIIFSVFGYLFFSIGDDFWVLICVTMVGSLLGFLYYNLHKKSAKKTFMGDTGSMTLGYLFAILSIRLLALDGTSLETLGFNRGNLPIVVIAILVVPFFDTCRVFLLRILNKKNPFNPDRNHIHHVIVDRLDISHRRASFLIGLVHFVLVLILVFLAINTPQTELLLTFSILILAAIIFFFHLNNPDYLRWAKLKKKRKLNQYKNNFKKSEG